MENDDIIFYQKMVLPKNFQATLKKYKSDLIRTQVPKETTFKIRNLFAQDFCIVILLSGKNEEKVEQRRTECLDYLRTFLDLSGKVVFFDEPSWMDSLRDYLQILENNLIHTIYPVELCLLRDSAHYCVLSTRQNFFNMSKEDMEKDGWRPTISVQSYTVEYESGLFESRIVIVNNKKIVDSEEFTQKLIKDCIDERAKMIKEKFENKKLGSKRNPIGPKLRHEVFKRDNYKCIDCGFTKEEGTLHVDHVLPVSQGGTDELSNLQTLCYKCNLAKSNRSWGKQRIQDAV